MWRVKASVVSMVIRNSGLWPPNWASLASRFQEWQNSTILGTAWWSKFLSTAWILTKAIFSPTCSCIKSCIYCWEVYFLVEGSFNWNYWQCELLRHRQQFYFCPMGWGGLIKWFSYRIIYNNNWCYSHFLHFLCIVKCTRVFRQLYSLCSHLQFALFLLWLLLAQPKRLYFIQIFTLYFCNGNFII